MSEAKLLICPYCGQTQPEAERCKSCGGLFEPLSRQATHNAMGPWFIRDPQRPFQPGCSYGTLLKLVQRGQITRYTIVRGPTTRQFWTIASRVPGLSHLFGSCHQCDASVDPGDHACHACGVTFGALQDRNYLGLPEYRPLPWEADERDESGERMAYDGPADLPRTAPSAGSPRGLSSFASDEELFGMPANPRDEDAQHDNTADEQGAAEAAREDASAATNGHPAHAARDADGASSTESQAATAVETEPETSHAKASPPALMPHAEAVPREDPVTRTSMRAMERRLAQEQRARQRLGVVALVAGVIAITASIAWLAARQGATPGMPGDTEAAETSDADDRDIDIRNDDAVVPDHPDDPFMDTADMNRRDDAEPWTEQRVETLLSEAQSLLDDAADENRELDSRISDIEQAIQKLVLVRESPDEWRPDDLADRISDARQQRDRLRLQGFFP